MNGVKIINILGQIKKPKDYKEYCEIRCNICKKEKVMRTERAVKAKSCWCQKSLIVRRMFTKHGLSNTRVKRIYYGMLTRCNNESDLAYPYYGGRGIGVCERWEKSIENFYEDMGYPPPKYTLDRIDNNGNYEPKNCRWATRKTQMANRRNNHIINFNGKSKNITDWSDDLGINYATLIKRVKRYGINKYTISSNRYKKEELKLILGVK